MFVPMLVTDFLRRAVKQYGKKIGVVDREKRFTYAQLGERVNRLTNGLLNLGVKKGDRVAMIDYNSHRYLEAYFGIPQMGATFVPINIRYRPREVSYVLNDSEAKYLMVNEAFSNIVKELKGELRSIEKFILLRDNVGQTELGIEGIEYEDLSTCSSHVIDIDFMLSETDPAEIFYTSGTTSHPKGVPLTHRNLYFQVLNVGFSERYTDRSVVLQAIPLFHANGWGNPHLLTAVGGRHIILREFRPELVCELIERERVTNMQLVPTMTEMLLNYVDMGRYDLSSLERITIGGSPISENLRKSVEEKIGCELVEAYGLTEALYSTIAPLKDYLSKRSEVEKRRKILRSGFETFTAQVRVVNEKGEEVKPDSKEKGEVIVRGNHVTDGYWRLPEETERTFVNGWFHTGDVATVDEDGYIKIVDRIKDMIISGGENISAAEAEEVILQHPAISEVAVVAAPSEKWGETPVAVVVLKEGQSVTSEELISFCKKELGFKSPTIVEFVDSLPKSGTGKILKRELRERFRKGNKK